MRNLFLALFGLIAINSFGQLNFQQVGQTIQFGGYSADFEYIESIDEMYLIYQWWLTPGKVYLKKFDGSLWVDAHPTDSVLAYNGSYPKMEYNELSDTLFMAFTKTDADSLVLIMNNGSTWTEKAIGIPNLNVNDNLLMAIHDSTNTPYFMVQTNSGFEFWKYDVQLDQFVSLLSPGGDIVTAVLYSTDLVVNNNNGDIFFGYHSIYGATIRRWTGSNWQLLHQNIAEQNPSQLSGIKFLLNEDIDKMFIHLMYNTTSPFTALLQMNLTTYDLTTISAEQTFGGVYYAPRAMAYNENDGTIAIQEKLGGNTDSTYLRFCNEQGCSDYTYFPYDGNRGALEYNNNNELFMHDFGPYFKVLKVSGVSANISGQKDQAFRIYPNPTSSELNVITELNSAISLVNSLGQVVYSDEQNKTNFNIDVNNLTPGIYFLQIRDQSGSTSTEKIIIQ